MARVLVIDEASDDRTSILAALDSEHTTEYAEDSRTALFLLTASTWDVVVFDPVGDSVDAKAIMRHIREKASPPEVIVATTEHKLEAVIETLRAGAFEFVPKPIDKIALRKTVANAAQLRRLQDDKRQLDADRRQERKDLTALVAERTRQMEQLFSNVPGMLYRMVVAANDQRRFSFISVSCADLLELSEELLLQDPYRFDALLHPDDAPRFRRDRAAAERSKQQFRFEGRFVLRSGRTRWLQCVAKPSPQEDGTVLWDGIITDVTERNELESQLLLADRLASVGSMAAAVAHEVNNPLAFMQSNLAQLGKELARQPQAAEVQQLLAETMTGLVRIETAVKDLRTFARSSVESIHPVQLSAVLDSCIRLANNEIRHRSSLSKSYESSACVLADESNLGQLFLNLLISMAQTIPEGEVGRYQIKVRLWDSSLDRVTVELSDNGPGLSNEVLGRAFEPLSDKPRQEGIGLYVCHRVVSGLGGQITAGRAHAGGTRFRVTLPSQASCDNVLRFPTPQKKHPRSARVLVVDDEELVVKALCRALEGHDVTSASSGREAIEIIKHQEPFDLVLCDVMMPDLTGADVYDAARHMGAEDRIVFVTGGAFTSSAQAFLESVPNRRIEKPFSRDSVRALLNSPT